MDVGWRVIRKDDNATGLVIRVLFQGSKNEDGSWREEVEVKWDDGSRTWEPRDDVKRTANKLGDVSRVEGTGMGLVEGLVSREHPNLHKKDDAQVYALRCMGILPIPKVRRSDARPARPQPDERREKLARQAATGEPMLVRKGVLRSPCFTRPYKTGLGWAARAIKLGPKNRIRRHSKW